MNRIVQGFSGTSCLPIVDKGKPEPKKRNFLQKIINFFTKTQSNKKISAIYSITLNPGFGLKDRRIILDFIRSENRNGQTDDWESPYIGFKEGIYNSDNSKCVGNLYIQYIEVGPLYLSDFNALPIFPDAKSRSLETIGKNHDAIGLFFCLDEFQYNYAIINLYHNRFILNTCFYYQNEQVLLSCFFEEYVMLRMSHEFYGNDLSIEQMGRLEDLKSAINYINDLVATLSLDLRSSDCEIYFSVRALFPDEIEVNNFQRRIMRDIGWDFEKLVIKDGFSQHNLYRYIGTTSEKISNLSLAFGLGVSAEMRPVSSVKSAKAKNIHPDFGGR